MMEVFSATNYQKKTRNQLIATEDVGRLASHELERWKSSPQPITYKKCRHQIVATKSVGPLAQLGLITSTVIHSDYQKNQLAMKCIRGPTPKSWII